MPCPNDSAAPAPRLASLDALRGFTMFWIVGADAFAEAFGGLHGGAVTAFLNRQMGHTTWEGFTFYDLIFPLFIFMIGAAVPLSLNRIVEREGRAAALRRVLRRGVIMYGLGLFYYGGIAEGWGHVRWVGVLQRLAFCYVAVSALHLWFGPRTIAAIAVGVLIGYWALLTFVPVPGFGAGDYGRGHNLANWIDAHYLPGRVWYGNYDPEGPLSTLPAIASAIFGLFAGRLLSDPSRASAQKVWLLAVTGLVLLATGWLWGLQFPVIKRIWTSSYALVAGGWSMLLLAFFYQVIDRWTVRAWAAPFTWIGANALAIYLLSNLVDFRKVSARLVGGDVAAGLDALCPGLSGLVLALVSVTLCVLIGRFLYVRKIFLRI